MNIKNCSQKKPNDSFLHRLSKRNVEKLQSDISEQKKKQKENICLYQLMITDI